MTFLEYFLFIDVPVSIVVFLLILFFIRKNVEIKKKAALELLHELDSAEDDYYEPIESDYMNTVPEFFTEETNGYAVEDTPVKPFPAEYAPVKPFPAWLLHRASYKQFMNYLQNNNLVVHDFMNLTWPELHRLLVKIEKIRNSDACEGSLNQMLAEQLENSIKDLMGI